jgi:hypothetical protein
MFVRDIVPETSKTHTLGPDAPVHAANDPEPDALRLVTLCIVVFGVLKLRPLPATVSIPNPKAPGIIGKKPEGGIGVSVGVGVYVGVIIGTSVTHPIGQIGAGVGVNVGVGVCVDVGVGDE